MVLRETPEDCRVVERGEMYVVVMQRAEWYVSNVAVRLPPLVVTVCIFFLFPYTFLFGCFPHLLTVLHLPCLCTVCVGGRGTGAACILHTWKNEIAVIVANKTSGDFYSDWFSSFSSI